MCAPTSANPCRRACSPPGSRMTRRTGPTTGSYRYDTSSSPTARAHTHTHVRRYRYRIHSFHHMYMNHASFAAAAPSSSLVGVPPETCPARDDIAHALRSSRRLSIGDVVGDQTRVPRTREDAPSRRGVVVERRRYVCENLARVRCAQESRLASRVRRRRARADDVEIVHCVLSRVAAGERELGTTTGV